MFSLPPLIFNLCRSARASSHVRCKSTKMANFC